MKIASYRWDDLAPGAFATGPGGDHRRRSDGRRAADGIGFAVDGFGNVVLTSSDVAPRPRASHCALASAIEFEIFKNLFLSIAEEMGVTLCRTGFSPNIKERLDYSCAVYDATGRDDRAGRSHAGASRRDAACRCAPRSTPSRMEPGDIVMLNDPFHGGTHLPDITLVSPVFLGRRDRAADVLRRQSRPSLRRRRHEPRVDAGGARDLPGRPDPAAGSCSRGAARSSATSWRCCSPTCARQTSARAICRRRSPPIAWPSRGCARPCAATAASRRSGYASALQDYTERVIRAAIRDIPDGRYDVRRRARRRRLQRDAGADSRRGDDRGRSCDG